jgi:hypothetical protein
MAQCHKTYEDINWTSEQLRHSLSPKDKRFVARENNILGA